VLNPKRVRDFAKGVGADAKTDRIDAQVISEYARAVNPPVHGNHRCDPPQPHDQGVLLTPQVQRLRIESGHRRVHA